MQVAILQVADIASGSKDRELRNIIHELTEAKHTIDISEHEQDVLQSACVRLNQIEGNTKKGPNRKEYRRQYRRAG